MAVQQEDRDGQSDSGGQGDNGIPLSEAVQRITDQGEKSFDPSKSAMHRGMYQWDHFRF